MSEGETVSTKDERDVLDSLSGEVQAAQGEALLLLDEVNELRAAVSRLESENAAALEVLTQVYGMLDEDGYAADDRVMRLIQRSAAALREAESGGEG